MKSTDIKPMNLALTNESPHEYSVKTAKSFSKLGVSKKIRIYWEITPETKVRLKTYCSSRNIQINYFMNACFSELVMIEVNNFPRLDDIMQKYEKKRKSHEP